MEWNKQTNRKTKRAKQKSYAIDVVTHTSSHTEGSHRSKNQNPQYICKENKAKRKKAKAKKLTKYDDTKVCLKTPVSLFCVSYLLLVMELTLKSCLFIHWDTFGENLVFICKWLWIWDKFWVRDGTCVHRAGVSYGTDPCKPCACCPSLCEFICISVLLCLEGLALLVSSFPSGSYTLSAFSSAEFSGPWGEGFDGDITSRTGCSKASH